MYHLRIQSTVSLCKLTLLPKVQQDYVLKLLSAQLWLCNQGHRSRFLHQATPLFNLTIGHAQNSSFSLTARLVLQPYQTFLLNHISHRTTASRSGSSDRKTLSTAHSKARGLEVEVDSLRCAGDLAYCFICLNGIKSGKVNKGSTGHAGESAFISGGFYNWKDATRCFNKHEASLLHKVSVDAVITVP